MNDDIDEIREKKMQQLQEQYEEQQRQEQQSAEAGRQLNTIVRRLLSEEARTRLNNVKLVNNELYLAAAQAILYLYKAGQLKERLQDEQLKDLLEKLRSKKEVKIRRK